ncbi:hypothetical protein [Arthrobacter ruber]|uniref:hypothetical protein n=1 Tax=Arthrobacter ruber TaxID=1258893 RepID=UPI000CF4766D|nr:hypothetical protein [Arthrobacter ruber]
MRTTSHRLLAPSIRSDERAGFLRPRRSLMGLRPVADDVFSENRVGLDHVAFAVEDRDVLDDAARQLDDRPLTPWSEGHRRGLHPGVPRS